jgi:hypothetical protein
MFPRFDLVFSALGPASSEKEAPKVSAVPQAHPCDAQFRLCMMMATDLVWAAPGARSPLCPDLVRVRG